MIPLSAAREVAALLAGVGEPTRMAILLDLAGGASAVGPLAERVGVPMVNMSHHLNVLRRAGIVENEKRGRQVIYSLSPAAYTPAPAGGTLQAGGWRLSFAAPVAEPAAKPAKRRRPRPVAAASA